MHTADMEGVISSVLYGPDRRTRIRAETREAFFAVYAPPGVREELVQHHLEEVQEYVRVFSPEARVELLAVYGGAGSGI